MRLSPGRRRSAPTTGRTQPQRSTRWATGTATAGPAPSSTAPAPEARTWRRSSLRPSACPPASRPQPVSRSTGRGPPIYPGARPGSQLSRGPCSSHPPTFGTSFCPCVERWLSKSTRAGNFEGPAGSHRLAMAKRDELGDDDVAHGDLLSVVEAAPTDLVHFGFERFTVEPTHAAAGHDHPPGPVPPGQRAQA